MPPRRSRRNTARGTPRREASNRLPQLPPQEVRNPFPPLEVLSADQLEAIHEASMHILETIGLEIVNDKAIALMRQHGAEIDPKTGYVCMDRGLLLRQLETVPGEFTLHARNPARNVVIGGNRIQFSPVASAPNSSDMDRGRRTGNLKDFQDFLRLTQYFNLITLTTGYPVEPIDCPANSRHLDANQAFITLTDKPWGVYSLGDGRIEDGLEMIKIARGIDDATLKREPSISTVVNTNSPLKVDEAMLDGLMTMAEYGQVVVVTPFTLAGAMSPVTLAGALAQQNAEALGMIAVTQMVNPGAPAIYGGFTSNVDMKTGSPAFGTPEYAKAVLASGQLARRYGIPYRTSNVNAANVADAQATWESGISVWSAIMGHGNLIKHCAGWLEGGLCASFEKFVLDVEMLQIMVQSLSGIEVSEETLALDAIREVGAGGHFFGTDHTYARFETAFHTPFLSDWRNFETWSEAGSQTATERAHRVYKQALADYQQPDIDQAISEEIAAYVKRRKTSYK